MTRGYRLLFFLLLLQGMLLLPFPVQGQADDVVTATWVSDPPPPNGWTVGDRIPLRLQVKNSGQLDITVAWPTLPSQWGPFEVTAQQNSGAEILADGGIALLTVDVLLWAPGAYETPPLELTYTTSTSSSAAVTPQPFTVDIVTVLTADETERRALKAQATLPRPRLWPWLTAGGVGLLLLGGSGWWFWRRLQRTARVIVEQRPAREIAFAELDRIAALQLLEQGKLPQQTILVTDCLRLYLETMTAIPAMERTTDEVLAALRRTPLHPLLPKLKAILETADLVKFAGGTAGEAESRDLVTQARQLIDEIESCFNLPTPGG